MEPSQVTRRAVESFLQTQPEARAEGRDSVASGVRHHSSDGLGKAATMAPSVRAVGPAHVKTAVADTLATRLHGLGRTIPDAPAYHAKVDGKFVATTWKTYSQEVTAAAKGLMALGAGKGDCITIYAFNCPTWAQADLAANTIGTITTGAYPDLAPKGVAHTIAHSESRIVFVQDLAMWKNLEPVLGDMPHVEHFVFMEGDKPAHAKAMTWKDFIVNGEPVADEDVEARTRAVRPDDTATIIYTSGTSGKPKGCELSHANLAFTGTTFADITKLGPSDRTVCYLRLGHIADRMFSIAGPVSSGMQVYFSEIERLKKDLPKINPTVLFAAPRVWDTIASGIDAKAANVTGMKRRLTPLVQAVARKAAHARALGKEPSGLAFWGVNRFVLQDVLQASGLAHVRFAVNGGGSMKPGTERSLANIGIVLSDAYGQSESSGIISCARPGVWRRGTLGTAAPGVDTKLSETGELLVRGPNVFKGYFKNPDATAKVIRGGWLHTGDLARLTDGFVTYEGRADRVGKLANAEKVSPYPIEAALVGGVIGDSVAVFDGRDFVTAVVMLNEQVAQQIAEGGKPLHDDPAVLEAVKKQVTAANGQLEGYTRVRGYFVVDRPLTAGDDGEIGSTGKLKPSAVEKAFAAPIAALYAKPAKGKK